MTHKEVIDNPIKKNKCDQKLTWHETITRELKTIDIGTKNSDQSFTKQRLETFTILK